ncbi:hypothetical protein [uncultured Piscinibacter sp.]|uniref:hypothetical protein n=1 Tax=uncultured Piscinibacter sp. TaxID=1131835 RepID=UPI002621E5D4|nr:hypothetical protein [uncultured Piscinibacter sp.]
MDALHGGARSGESTPAGARLDAGTLAAAAEVNRHHAQRLEAQRRDPMPAPEEVGDDEPDERT